MDNKYKCFQKHVLIVDDLLLLIAALGALIAQTLDKKIKGGMSVAGE